MDLCSSPCIIYYPCGNMVYIFFSVPSVPGNEEEEYIISILAPVSLSSHIFLSRILYDLSNICP